jgi:hypothetical protein
VNLSVYHLSDLLERAAALTNTSTKGGQAVKMLKSACYIRHLSCMKEKSPFGSGAYGLHTVSQTLDPKASCCSEQLAPRMTSIACTMHFGILTLPVSQKLASLSEACREDPACGK